ncbi:hypothetical protein E1265_12835 [Streptomyces sp. 8K308]|uniref:hypothetical protein n=1 Tax=Streptomyces sp. 8K308 TaxID=2530388 RepID=UPI00104C2944|nr:hypothetical protein [Streptomyces sp. 8K308]TDC23417.1 hypothetical protein E1265_12835 [Streptomyces sp. 8K308]
MARKAFALHTEPHIADVGGTELAFQPEVMGDQFVTNYEALQNRLEDGGVDLNNLAGVTASAMRMTTTAIRMFIASVMVPESASMFARWDVVRDGQVLATFQNPDDAGELAADTQGAEVVDASMPLPDRILVGLLEWAIELYGGGRPPTSSTDSAAPSPTPGRRGTASSRSRASTRTSGR